MSQINLGTNDIGFKDDNDNGSVTSLRTSQDLKYAFSIYFVEKLSFLHIVALKNEDAEALNKFNLRKENMNKKNHESSSDNMKVLDTVFLRSIIILL